MTSCCWCVACIPKRRECNNRNYCIDFNQILLNDKDRQKHRVARTGSEICYLRCWLYCIPAESIMCSTFSSQSGLMVCPSRFIAASRSPTLILFSLFLSNALNASFAAARNEFHETSFYATFPYGKRRQLVSDLSSGRVAKGVDLTGLLGGT